MNCCGIKSEYKHSKDECKVVISSIKDIIRQVSKVNDEYLRTQLCESAKEMCDQLLREPDE